MPETAAKGIAQVPQSEGWAPALSLRHLAHELNSLLDGSLRCLGVAERLIEASAAADGSACDAAAKLRLARQSMRHMADLLERAMSGPAISTAVFCDEASLSQAVGFMIAAMKENSSAPDIEVSLARIDPALAAIPVGALGPVIMNGLRNASQACAAAKGRPPSGHRVEMSISLNDDQSLLLTITDTGSGVSADAPRRQPLPGTGHGIGLEICHRIATSLAGTVSLENRTDGRSGAIFTLRVPGRNLTHPEPVPTGSDARFRRGRSRI